MIPLKKVMSSSIGQKWLTALTGVGLVGFTIMHLAGNLTLLAPNPDVFNTYAEKLISLGALLEIAEIGLVTVFVLHIVNGIRLKMHNSKARGVSYTRWQSKGAQQSNHSSRGMIFSGIFLLAFLIIHLLQFKFGPGLADGYVTELEGKQVRDLHKLVFETFQSPWTVGFYVLAMIFLWMHLRHGFWSMFQSLGMMSPRMTGPVHCLGKLVAFLLAVGFLALPIWLYFNVGGMLS